ncbi:MAG: hypothetical protein A2V84_02670 [Chloroflexi bacterium RBG_16_70_13]|nr:MAG: hypothetical protein A2V84_02670 [Chloroflexi bacterium RBG_16_70_13]
MATDALTTAPAAAADDRARPYAPSLLDRLYDWIESLPVPIWLTYVVLAVAGALLATSSQWLSGLRRFPDPEPVQLVWGAITIVLLAAPHRLRLVARSSFEQFRPALGTGVAEPELVRYELTVMRPRPILAIIAFNFVITPLYYAIDPVASQVVGITPAGLVPRLLSEATVGTVLVAILYQAIRQMRIVGRLHAVADRVDPFRPSPLYAFSRLTAEVGFVLIAFNALGMLLNPGIFESAAALVIYLPWIAGFTIVAIVVFLVPLLGMHRRLERAKDRHEDAASDRLRDLLGELNEAIDARATDRVDALDRTISALRHERELLAKLPTWPWSAGTIRGFGSALLLPIAVFLVQRFLTQVLT